MFLDEIHTYVCHDEVSLALACSRVLPLANMLLLDNAHYMIGVGRHETLGWKSFTL